MKPWLPALALLLAAARLFTAEARAADYPAVPVRIVVPFSGGGTDTLVRTYAAAMQASLKQAVVVDNKPGGNTIIGADAAAKAPPDGYTLLAVLDSTMTMMPAAYSKMPYDPDRSFDAVSLLAQQHTFLVVNPKLPITTLKELIDYSKANPGKLNYGSAVISGEVLGSGLKAATGMNYAYIPYKGGAQAMQAMLAGEVDFLIVDLATGISFINDGKIRALATLAPTRSAQLPDVPTMREAGFPEVERMTWYGLYAPAGTPVEILRRLSAEVAKASQQPELRKRLAALGYEPVSSTPEELTRLTARDATRWRKAVREAGIRFD